MGKEKIHILLVEDQNAHVELIRDAFEELGSDNIRLTVAGSLQKARERMAESTPDLVITDFVLPDGKAMELVSSLQGSDVPVVMMTSQGDEEVAVEAMKAGALDYVVKSDYTFSMMPHIAWRALREWRLIAEQKRAEEALQESNRRLEAATKTLQQNQSQLIQSEKMAGIGQLAAGVAHEINNPVGYVKSNLGTLSEYVATLKELVEQYRRLETAMDDGDESGRVAIRKEIEKINAEEDLSFMMEDVDHLLEESKEGTERVREIVAGLKSFARVDEAQVKEADVNELIETTLKIVWNELKYNCTVHKDLKPLPSLRCHPGQLNQVFMNLFVNAAQSIPGKGDITISTKATRQYIVIEVTDTGVGIPAENLPRLFDPFFTTKQVGKGTGLGLSISHGIIHEHNGTIEVKSEVGKGTTFTVRLPVEGVSDE